MGEMKEEAKIDLMLKTTGNLDMLLAEQHSLHFSVNIPYIISNVILRNSCIIIVELLLACSISNIITIT